jgi:hypothetical protein
MMANQRACKFSAVLDFNKPLEAAHLANCMTTDPIKE